MLKRFFCVVLVILFTITATVCNAAAAGNKPGTGPQKPMMPGWVTGRATDSSGKPLSNVYVRIEGITNAGEQVALITKTGADGKYSLKVPPGSYRVACGSIAVNYNGRFFQMPLEPVDGDISTDYPSTAGINRDLVWKISGLREGTTDLNSLNSYRGAYVKLTRWREAKLDPLWGQNSVIEITLTPTGPLIDGSQGKPVIHKMSDMTYDNWVDVPIGDYTVTAQLLQNDGQKRPLRVGVSTFRPTTDTYNSAALVQFPPEEGKPAYPSIRGVKYLYISFRPD